MQRMCANSASLVGLDSPSDAADDKVAISKTTLLLMVYLEPRHQLVNRQVGQLGVVKCCASSIIETGTHQLLPTFLAVLQSVASLQFIFVGEVDHVED